MMEFERPWLVRRANLQPEQIALSCEGETLTFGQLSLRANMSAARLRALGIRPDDRVAVLMDNSVQMAEVIHAVQLSGATLVPINTRLTPQEVEYLLDDASPALLLFDDSNSSHLPGTHDRLTALEVGRELRTVAPARAFIPVKPRAQAIHSIIYTSGTTGRAKGAMLTNANVVASAEASRRNLGSQRDDRWLAVLPLYHIGGLSILWRSVLDGIPVTLHRRFDAAAANETIRTQPITLMSVVSTMLSRMFELNGTEPYPETLRTVLLGGGPVPEILIGQSVKLRVPVAPTYGLTEAASQVATMIPREVMARPASCGRPLAGTRVRIGDPDEQGRGEIMVQGPTVMAGYFRKPEATAKTLREGWLHTGDIGRLDADGYLYIDDRRDDLIVSGGENVYPAEVESVLLSHPEVREAAVFGLRDQTWGQRVAAAVVLRDGAQANGETLARWCGDRLARFKIPRQFDFVIELPRTASGKIKRHLLRRD